MAKSMKGLKVKPIYDNRIGIAKSDNLQILNSLTEMQNLFEKVF